jgi:hypothetical protein
LRIFVYTGENRARRGGAAGRPAQKAAIYRHNFAPDGNP